MKDFLIFFSWHCLYIALMGAWLYIGIKLAPMKNRYTDRRAAFCLLLYGPIGWIALGWFTYDKAKDRFNRWLDAEKP